MSLNSPSIFGFIINSKTMSVIVKMLAIIFCYMLFPFPCQETYGEDIRGRKALVFRAGAAKVDITPERNVPLGGYGTRRGKPSKGVNDRIYVRAVIMDDGRKRIALCNVDLVIVTERLWMAVKEKVNNIPLDALLLFATHNHSGMGGYVDNFIAEMVGMGWYDENIFRRLVDRISGAIKEADSNLIASSLGWGSVNDSNHSRNRRVQGGPIDPEIGVVTIQDEGKKPVAMFVNFAAHPTVLDGKNMLISGDYPGFLARSLEERVGGVVLFANGASADIGPKIAGFDDRFGRAKDMGDSLAGKVMGVLDRIETRRNSLIAVVEKEIILPSRPDLTPIFRFPFLTDFMNLLADIWFPERTTLQIISIDDLLLIGIPCELGAEVGIEIKRAALPEKAYVFSLANDYIGYAVSRDLYRKGVYEAKASFYGPGLVDLLKEEVFEMTRMIQEKRHVVLQSLRSYQSPEVEPRVAGSSGD